MKAKGNLSLTVGFEQTLVEVRFLQSIIEVFAAVFCDGEEVCEFQDLVDRDLV